jgi:RNA polymerase sigma factor (sigma-70 family)
MGIIKKRAYDLDFSQFDEEIIILMAQFGSQPARNELIERYHPSVKKQVDRLARFKGLPEDEIPDAEQNAVFAIDEAIRKYSLNQPTKTGKCSFPSYLHRVVECQLLDSIKSFRRKAKHTDSSVRAKQAFQELAEGTAPAQSRSVAKEKHALGVQGKTIDPEAEAEANEFWQRWSDAIARLIPEDRRFYEACCSGKPMRLIALDVGVSERTLYEKKRGMLARLRASLGSVPTLFPIPRGGG